MIEHLRKYTGLIIFVIALLFIGLAFVGDNVTKGHRSGNDPLVLSVDGDQYTASEVQKLGSMPMAMVSGFHMFDFYEFASILGGVGGAPEALHRAFVNRLNIRQAAEDYGVHPSKEEIFAEIKKMTAFQGSDGAFSQANYNDFMTKSISRAGLVESDFLDLVSDKIATRKLTEIIGGGLAVDRNFAANMVARNDQQVTLQLTRLPLSKFQDELKPTDEELTAHWDTTKERYQTDRKIKVSYIIAKPTYPELPKEEVKLPDAVTEEQKKEAEAKATEKKAADEAKLAEDKRRIDGEMADTVDTFLHNINETEGKDFAKLAEENGWTVVTTDLFARTSLPTELSINTRSTSNPRPIGDFLFQISPGTDAMSRFSDALPIADGAYLVAHLDEAEEARTKTFDEAKEQVLVDYIAEKAGEALKKDADEKAAKIREALTAGKTFADAAKELGLEVKSLPAFKSADKVPDEADSSALFEAAATVDPGTLADPLMRPDGATFIFVEKRELVNDPGRDERVNQSLTGLASTQQRIAFSAWLEEKLAAAQIVDLTKKP
ncbi:SurA N-terminal domain-containing protein [Luteolibacter flavescens]|uniref:SurA N-terminal domain-containing protein n=1 Tax=Luteolibacter flavescens TaxID=1859460 RepID=A0ABT3FPW1_9BACT|nr:SurA N-terminal domain-containing protein [Luteolibacter flavescens]MCW1885359.1 SurA N-terminal domain-containing protein [Luteolibacter flavescens]